MTDGLKGGLVVAFVVVVLFVAFVVFRSRTAAQAQAIRRGETPPVLPTTWDTGDPQDTMDAQGAHH